MSLPAHPGNLPGHIRHLQIPTPFPIGDVNVYLIRDSRNILIDCGPKTPGALQALVHQLDAEGLTLHDIDELWITHGHSDHFGLARKLRDEYDIKVFAHRAEIHNFRKNSNSARFVTFFAESGVPDHLVYEMEMQRKWIEVYFDVPEIDHWISDGDVLSSGNHKFRVHHLPGHSPGHVGFTDDGENMLTGDVLLQRISSNAILSFDPETGSRMNTLHQLRQSMQKIAGLRGWVLPGHGSPFTGAAETVRHHLDSHDRRYRKILDILSEKPMNLFQVTSRLFPEVERAELTFLCLSEVSGYLDRAKIEGFTGSEIHRDTTMFIPAAGYRGAAS